RRVQRETNRSQNHSYKSPSYRSACHRLNGAPMRPPLRSSGPRPHGDSMRPFFRPTGHRPHAPSINLRRPTINVQFEPYVQASKAKRATRNHDPLSLIAHSNASSSQSHANPSYSQSPQSYYVTHPSTVVDYEDYQGELQRDTQDDKIRTTMMLLAREITQKFSTPTNNRLRTSSNTRNQALIQDGKVDIQTKIEGYCGTENNNGRRQNKNQAFNAGNRNDESNQIIQHVSRTMSNQGKVNVYCYNCNEKVHYARDCSKPTVRDAKYF
nr:hypothetical protein [Tanacetum cinerariifolium]